MKDKDEDKEQGFFVKIRDDLYSRGYETLNQAREYARSIGPNLLIYHGILRKISEGVIDDKELFLVPKLDKES